jgi:hypothetical protein
MLTSATAIVTIVTAAPAHDFGLFLFDATWIAIGLDQLNRRRPLPPQVPSPNQHEVVTGHTEDTGHPGDAAGGAAGIR